MAHAVVGAVDVDVHHLHPVVRARLRERSVLGGHAGIVERAIEAAVGRTNGRERLLDLRRITDIAGDETAVFTQPIGQRRAFFFVPTEHDHIGAGLDQAFADGFANATGAAGDQAHFSQKIVHMSHLLMPTRGVNISGLRSNTPDPVADCFCH